ncbi:MAG: hypothetical protein IPL63_06850 [Saprospiraceae bacterium]|nr:hypothetical protein [Saprospiraceae bacterium]MBK8079269.1 hypothetical protein [Saprospiraceae bacterium]MBK8371834.1 hypothetical protein [Saprospiraceae bacterium]MBK8547099.1 hypothetical protein [Saprospiraceae bacterium]MBK8853309.1 hypothetical protein [Saprospiraceae bacterium]
MGRIASIYNKTHLNIYDDDTGFFGFFESIDNALVAKELLKSASDWLKAKGLNKMIGPENLSTNDTIGILTRGFDQPPVIMMPYNYPYYERLLKDCGLTPTMTLFSYLMKTDSMPTNLLNRAELFENRLQKSGIQIRTIDLKNFDNEINALQPVYNSANQGNWGFLPLDTVGFQHMAKEMKQLVNDENILIAEKDGKIIGYAVTLPDFNQVFKKIPKGRLLPFGWYYLLTGRNNILGLRIIIMGVLPAYRGQGIDWCFYSKITAYAKKKGILWGEACYVMESNLQMNKMLKLLGATIVKEYKLFEMNL